MVQYARIETRTAYLSTDFGTSYATRLFGADAIAALAKISRGKRKGQTKGLLVWSKATVGGWHRDGYGEGHVVYPGFIDAHIEVDGKKILETNYPCYEKFLAAKAEAEALRSKDYKALALSDLANELLDDGDVDGYRAAIAKRDAYLNASSEAEIDAEIARRLAAKQAT